jgi:hypothetical protein
MEMLDKSVTLFRELGDRWGLAISLVQAGEIRMSAGQYPQARHYFLEAIQKSAEAQVTPVMLDALLGFASLLIADDSYSDAYRITVVVLRQMEISQETRDRAENLYAESGKKLASAEIDIAQASLTTTTLDGLIKEIVGKEMQYPNGHT